LSQIAFTHNISPNLPAPINASLDPQTKAGSLTIGGNLTTGSFTMLEGAEANKVLTTNASGVATWQEAGGGSLWAQTGDDIYYNTGNVGIGTASPEEKLTVKGNFSLLSSDGVAQSRRMTLRFNKAADIDYVRLTLPQNYSGTNGGGVKVKIAWMAAHASRSAYQEYAFSYTTHHFNTNYLAISDVLSTVKRKAPLSYGPYEFSSEPNVNFYQDLTGGGVVMEIKGRSLTVGSTMMVEVEVFGRTVSAPALTYVGTSAPPGITALSVDSVGAGYASCIYECVAANIDCPAGYDTIITSKGTGCSQPGGIVWGLGYVGVGLIGNVTCGGTAYEYKEGLKFSPGGPVSPTTGLCQSTCGSTTYYASTCHVCCIK